MNKKSKLGQFFTINYDYILQNFELDFINKTVIEPFCGNGDLLNFKDIKNKTKIECYDIDPKHSYINLRDTLLNPPDYTNKILITNPPYLARNKNSNKKIYEKYNQNDLYKCFIVSIINNPCKEGIIIIPLNFFSSIRLSDIKLRKNFLFTFDIKFINIFEEKVFDDTSYTVCSIHFIKKDDKIVKPFLANIYPSNKCLTICLNSENNYTIGGEIYKLPQSKYKIERYTRKTKDVKSVTNMFLKCIDDNINSKICLSFIPTEKILIDDSEKLSFRSYASITVYPYLTNEIQKKVIENFNNFLTENREKYNSLFLNNYRESNSIARKRISFQLAFEIISYILLKF
jgi:hypothetical protein